jgi:hypothetical protein
MLGRVRCASVRLLVHGQVPLGSGPRRPDGRPGWISWVLPFSLECESGSKEHAEGRHRQAQRGDCRGSGGSRSPGRPRHFPPLKSAGSNRFPLFCGLDLYESGGSKAGNVLGYDLLARRGSRKKISMPENPTATALRFQSNAIYEPNGSTWATPLSLIGPGQSPSREMNFRLSINLPVRVRRSAARRA